MPTKPIRLPKLRSRKRKGDVAELVFLARAMRLGLNVCKPLCTDCPYDVLVEGLGRYSRVQVKSVWQEPQRRAYRVRISRGPRAGRGFYRSDQVDFFAAYVMLEDVWYIIPHEVVARQGDVALFPHQPDSRGALEKYREAWDLFLPRTMVIADLKACADPDFC